MSEFSSLLNNVNLWLGFKLSINKFRYGKFVQTQKRFLITTEPQIAGHGIAEVLHSYYYYIHLCIAIYRSISISHTVVTPSLIIKHDAFPHDSIDVAFLLLLHLTTHCYLEKYQ